VEEFRHAGMILESGLIIIGLFLEFWNCSK